MKTNKLRSYPHRHSNNTSFYRNLTTCKVFEICYRPTDKEKYANERPLHQNGLTEGKYVYHKDTFVEQHYLAA